MPKSKQKRMTLAEARKRYPDEWVVFVDLRIENDAFVDGVLLFHCKDQQECYATTKGLDANLARFYTGSIPYRKVTFYEESAFFKKIA